MSESKYFPFHENTNMEMSSVKSFFVDISDESYADTLSDTFEIPESVIQFEETNTELEAIILLYDYFLKQNMSISDSRNYYVLHGWKYKRAMSHGRCFQQ